MEFFVQPRDMAACSRGTNYYKVLYLLPWSIDQFLEIGLAPASCCSIAEKNMENIEKRKKDPLSNFSEPLMLRSRVVGCYKHMMSCVRY